MRFVIRPQVGPNPTVDHLLLTGNNVPFAASYASIGSTAGNRAERSFRELAHRQQVCRSGRSSVTAQAAAIQHSKDRGSVKPLNVSLRAKKATER
jgi:hypothetical protein